MIIQYTRIIFETATGTIQHVTSQDFPFADNWEPVEYDAGVSTAIDCEIETDFPNQDYGIGINQEMLRAREIIDGLEIVAGAPQIKPGAGARITAKISQMTVKPIDEQTIRAELEAQIKQHLTGIGKTETELLEEARTIDPRTPSTLAEMKTIKLLRMKRALNP